VADRPDRVENQVENAVKAGHLVKARAKDVPKAGPAAVVPKVGRAKDVPVETEVRAPAADGSISRRTSISKS
jgi:hypothetical protein